MCLLYDGAWLLLVGLSRKLCWNCTVGAELWSQPFAGVGEAAQPTVLTDLGLGLLLALYLCWCWRILWLEAPSPKDESLLPIKSYWAQVGCGRSGPKCLGRAGQEGWSEV